MTVGRTVKMQNFKKALMEQIFLMIFANLPLSLRLSGTNYQLTII